MKTYKILVAIPIVGVMFAIGLFVSARFRTRSLADPETLTTDPLLQKLQALNPQLRIVDEFGRVPVYWIRPRGVKEGILFPKSEAEGARVRVSECDLSAIPPQLLYPRRAETACLEVDNDNHKLSAFFFRTRDGRQDIISFYEAPLEKSRHFGTSRGKIEERAEYARGGDGSREFLFSYLLWERYDTVAFIGYREERKQ